jgi:hypothetical protein
MERRVADEILARQADAADALTPERAELLSLRARVAVLERVAWLGVVMSAQLKRGSTLAYLEAKRAEYAAGLSDGSAAPEMPPDERAYLGAKADALFRRIIAAVEEV